MVISLWGLHLFESALCYLKLGETYLGGPSLQRYCVRTPVTGTACLTVLSFSAPIPEDTFPSRESPGGVSPWSWGRAWVLPLESRCPKEAT